MVGVTSRSAHHGLALTEEFVMSSFLQLSTPLVARRLFLGQSGLVLSAAAVALLAGNEALAAKAGSPDASDVQILNTALGAELEAIAAYQLGAQSKLLQKPVLDLAVTFQGHHQEHADVLAQTVEKLGGKPVSAKAQYDFRAEHLRTQADVLRFAAKLEQGAVSAYLGAVPLFGNRDLAKAAASILGDEAMHWAVLRQALGAVPVPSAFVS
jgi:rubrerythrin